MKKLLIVLLLSFYTLTSCTKKDTETIKNVEAIKNIVGTIIFTGDIALDGCGWLIKIDDTNTAYFPVNLTDAYKKDKLSVIVNYHLLITKYQCSTNPNNVLSKINIDAIRNK